MKGASPVIPLFKQTIRLCQHAIAYITNKLLVFINNIENYLSMTRRLLLHNGQTNVIKCMHATLTYFQLPSLEDIHKFRHIKLL